MIIYKDTDSLFCGVHISQKELMSCKDKNKMQELAETEAKEILKEMEKYYEERINEQLEGPRIPFFIRLK